MLRNKKIKKHILIAFVLLVLSRIMMALVAFYNKSELPFYQIINQWDSGWYFKIAQNGYEVLPEITNGNLNYVSWAFFPLYPLLIRIVNTIVPIDISIISYMLSNLFTYISMVFSSLYLIDTKRENAIYLFYFTLLFGPYCFYFSSTYTESLFIMLLAMALYYSNQKQWIKAGVVCGLLSATKTVGVLFFFCILGKMICEENGNIFYEIREILRDGKKMLALFLCPSGLFCYMAYLYYHTGDVFAFVHAQRGWARRNELPWNIIREGLNSPQLIMKILTIFTIFGILLIVYSIYKKRYSEAFIMSYLILPGLFSGILSIPRYIVGSLVYYFNVSEILSKFKLLKYAVCIFSFLLGIVMIHFWYLSFEYFI